MGWTGCVRREKFRRDFVARTLHQFGSFCTEFCNATERCQMHKNSMKQYETWVLGSMGGWVRSLRKILTRLYGTNFCTTSARFASSFVRQPNGPECIQIVQYTPKLAFRVQWGGSVAFLMKNSDATSWHELLHQFGPFCIVFCKATKWSKCIQIVQNTPKHEFRVQWDGSGAFATKNSNVTSWHELLHKFGPFWTECCNATNCPKCTRIVRNAPKHEVTVQ